MTPTDALLNTIATNHGLELAGKAKLPATAGAKGRKRIEEDDALSAQQSSEQGDVTADAGSAQATPGAGPILLAQADTGVPAEQAAPTESPAGGASTGTAGATGTVNDGGNNIKLALGGLALGGIALAAGGGGGGSGGGSASAPTDSTPPGIAAIAISSATSIQNNTLNAGDTVSVTVTLSEATHVTGTPQLALTIGGTPVQANYASGSGSNALVFTYTILAGQTDANGISIAVNALSLNGGTLKDAAGNNATLSHAVVADNASYLVDTTAPVFTSGATASVAENTATGVTVYDATADSDSGVSYSLSGDDSALFNINTSTGAVTFKASPDFEAQTDADGNNIYDFAVSATDASGNTADQAVALTVSDVAETSLPVAGDAVIDLGIYGKLLAPVQVEGKWYYVWDMNGDGTHDGNQDTGGQWDCDGSVANAGGSGYQYDYAIHDLLDGIFTQDISGNANPGVDTTDTYRYATLNGVHLALPTANGGIAYPNGIDALQPGTAVADGATTNATYDELLAIWDAYNGTGTGTGMSGTPSGWQSFTYWSATPSASGHADVYLDGGIVDDNFDYYIYFVALQVL